MEFPLTKQSFGASLGCGQTCLLLLDKLLFQVQSIAGHGTQGMISVSHGLCPDSLGFSLLFAERGPTNSARLLDVSLIATRVSAMKSAQMSHKNGTQRPLFGFQNDFEWHKLPFCAPSLA